MTRLKKYLANGTLMTAVALTLRGLSVAFNAYISRKIGAEALGLYTLLGSVYSFALTLALSGINLTTTRLVSDALGENNPSKARISMKKCICYSLFFGTLSCILLLTFAEPLSVHVLKDARSTKALRLCAATLPLIAVTSCFNGYFTAVRRVYKNAITQVLEQLARIAFCAFLLSLAFGKSIENYCICLVLGGALAEILSFTVSLLLFVFERNLPKKIRHATPSYELNSPQNRISEQKRNKIRLFAPEFRIAEQKITRKMLSIALPLAFSTYFRSALLTIEHILIPIGIEKSGIGRGEALAEYGILQSMVMPLVLFPAAIIYSFSGLLVPEMAELKVQNNRKEVQYVAGRVCRFALIFAVGVAGILIRFADDFGTQIYGSAEAGKYIKLVAHIVPIMYLDTTVDNMLKGLGEHLYTMKINITDTIFSLIMVWILIPKMGIYGYIFLIIASEIFNASASIFKLYQISRFKFNTVKNVLIPVVSIGVGTWIFGEISGVNLVVRIVGAGAAYLAFLWLLGSVDKEEIRWLSGLFGRRKKRGKTPLKFRGKA